MAHPADAGALLAWMRTATPVAADGFDQQFGLFGTAPPLPAVKQGWMCCVGGNRHLHSVAVVGHRVVVLLSEVPAERGLRRGARQRWTQPPPRCHRRPTPDARPRAQHGGRTSATAVVARRANPTRS